MLGLCCCVDFSLVAASGGYSLVAVCGFLIAVVSLAEHGRALGHAGSSWSAWAQYLEHKDFVVPRQVGSCQTEIKPVSPAMAGRFFTTEPPGKPCIYFLMVFSLFPEPQQKGSK